jgi:hypothetical protein
VLYPPSSLGIVPETTAPDVAGGHSNGTSTQESGAPGDWQTTELAASGVLIGLAHILAVYVPAATHLGLQQENGPGGGHEADSRSSV